MPPTVISAATAVSGLFQAARRHHQEEEGRGRGHGRILGARHAAQDREQRLVESPVAGVAGGAVPEPRARVGVRDHQDAGDQHGDQKMPPAVAARPRRHDQPGQDLRLQRTAPATADRSGRPVSSAASARHRPQDREGVVVPAARDLDQRQRAPGQDEDALRRQPAAPQDPAPAAPARPSRRPPGSAFIAVTESCSQTTARAAICHAGGYSAE